MPVCLAVSAFANSTVKLFINGKELEPDVPPSIVNGRVIAPVRTIAEALGATVEWDEETYSVIIDSRDTEFARLRLLESMLEPKDPFTAVNTWAEGVKSRNGAVQYAIMSPALKDENYLNFVALNWVTGTSSPWIEEYEAAEKCRIDDYIYEFGVLFTYKDSTGSASATKAYVSVRNYDGKWLVNSIEEEHFPGNAELNNESIAYKNSDYGFKFTMPASWAGYTIVKEEWKGLPIDDQTGAGHIETGPVIKIRHPLWTSETPGKIYLLWCLVLTNGNHYKK